MTTPSAISHTLDPITERRRLSAWILLAAVLSFGVMSAPFFLGRVYVADDLGEFHLPVRNFYAVQLRVGRPFDWMPSLYGGFYVAAEGQLGPYHPLHVALYRWLPLGAAFDLELLLSYPLLFVGMLLFLKRLVDEPPAAYFGALAFTMSGFCLLHFVHPNAIAVIAHIPWLLLAIDVATGASSVGRRAAAELAIALLTASQLLLGYPQYVWFSLLVEVAYAGWRLATVRPGIGVVAWLLTAKLLGIFAGAVQLLPTLDALTGSLRRVPDVALADTGSLHPLNLVQLLAPYLFHTRVVGQNTHELGIYVGAVPALLVIWLLANYRRWGRWRPLVLATFALGALTLLLAAGQFGGLYRLQAWVPLANRFRFPCRAIVLVQFCLAVEAAIAMQLLLDTIRARSADTNHAQSNDRPLIAAFLASLALAIAGPLVWGEHTANVWLVVSGPILVGMAAGLIALTARGNRWAMIALVAFTALDLGAYGFSYAILSHTANLHEFVAAAPLPPNAANRRVVAPKTASGLRTGDRMLLAGIERVDGYAGLEPIKRLDYDSPAAMRVAGAGWVYHASSDRAGAGKTWTPVWPTARRARLVARTVAGLHVADLDALATDMAAVDEPVGLEPGPAGTVHVLVDEPGNIALETTASTRQLLVTTESFHAGWHVSIDGREARVVRVNGDFLGCVVEAGGHEVHLQFRPLSLRVGTLVSAGGLGLMVCVFWMRRRSRPFLAKREPHATTRD